MGSLSICNKRIAQTGICHGLALDIKIICIIEIENFKLKIGIEILVFHKNKYHHENSRKKLTRKQCYLVGLNDFDFFTNLTEYFQYCIFRDKNSRKIEVI